MASSTVDNVSELNTQGSSAMAPPSGRRRQRRTTGASGQLSDRSASTNAAYVTQPQQEQQLQVQS